MKRIHGTLVLVALVLATTVAVAGERVVIVSEKLLEPEIAVELNRLQSDIGASGYTVLRKSWNTSTDGGAEDLWSYLKGLYQAAGSLEGAVLVGNLPKARNSRSDQYTDLVYWNMALPYGDTFARNIWVSRMYALQKNGAEHLFGDEVKLLKRLLDANHGYRTGASRLPHSVYHWDNAYPGRGYAGDMYNALEIWPSVEYLSPHLGFQRGCELVHQESHGSPTAYNEGNTTIYNVHRFLVQARFANSSSCSSGDWGGVVNNQLFTRGGGNVLSYGASELAYSGHMVIMQDYLSDISFRARLAAGDGWGKAMLTSFPFNDFYRMIFYGDLSIPAKAAPANQMPVLDEFTASRISGPAPLMVNFSGGAASDPDPDGSVVLYEWFPQGACFGTVDPETSGSSSVLPRSQTYTLPHRYAARLEVADNYRARAHREVVISVAPDSSKPLRVNCGTARSEGTEKQPMYWQPDQDYTAASGEVWLHDQNFSEGTWGWTCVFGKNYVQSTPAYGVDNSDDDFLYNRWRYDYKKTGFGYRVPLANGQYTIKLGFAETNNNVVGKRLADVEIEGTQVLSGYDIVAEGGYRHAVTRTFVVSLSDGELNIDVFTSAGSETGAILNCFEVIPSGAPPANNPPVAVADSLDVDEDATGSCNVLANDSDPDGDLLTVVSWTAPAWGGVAYAGGGVFSYTPFAGFNGVDSFSYVVEDGRGGSATGTVSVSVSAANDDPEITSFMPGTPYTMNVGESEVFEVWAQDQDEDSLTYAWQIDGAGVGGGASDLQYAPSAADVGDHTIAVTVTDGKGGSVEHTWQVTVVDSGGGEGDPVTVVLQEGLNGYAGTRDTYVSSLDADRNRGGSTAMQTYHDGKVRVLIAFDLASVPAGATVRSAKLKLYCSTYSYPRDSYALSVHGITRTWTEGTAYYSFHEMDGATWNEHSYADGLSTVAGNWTAAGGDYAPTATASITSGLAAGTWQEWDITALAGKWVSGTQANNGVLVRSHVRAGVLLKYWSSEYTVNASLRPKLEITYTAGGDTNAPPVADDVSVTTDEGQSVAVTLSGSDPDNDSLSYELLSSPSNGSLAGILPDLTYTPKVNFSGADSFTYRVSDGQEYSNTATVRIDVTASGGDEVSLVLQEGLDGYAGTRDTYLADYDADRNFGGATTMQTYHDGRYRVLVAFDLSAVPAGATIQSAKLKLYCTKYSYPRDTYALSVHRVARSWTEGTAYYKSHDMDGATWDEHGQGGDLTSSGGNWASPGGDYDQTAAASITSGLAADSWLEWDVTALAGEWVSGAQANNGVLLRSHVSAGISLKYCSSEYAVDASLRPRLEITYTVK